MQTENDDVMSHSLRWTDNPRAAISTIYISQSNPTNKAQVALCMLPGSDKEMRFKDEYISTTAKIIPPSPPNYHINISEKVDGRRT